LAAGVVFISNLRSFEHSQPSDSDVTHSPPLGLAQSLYLSLPLPGTPISIALDIDLRNTSRPHVTSPNSCAGPSIDHRSRLQSGKLRDAASLALGVPGTRTALPTAAQEPAGWDASRLREPARHAPFTTGFISSGKRIRPLQAGALDCTCPAHLSQLSRQSRRLWLRLRGRPAVRIVDSAHERAIRRARLRHWPATVSAARRAAVLAVRPERHVRCGWRARLSIGVVAI
jgi:hypothetical protein